MDHIISTYHYDPEAVAEQIMDDTNRAARLQRLVPLEDARTEVILARLVRTLETQGDAIMAINEKLEQLTAAVKDEITGVRQSFEAQVADLTAKNASAQEVADAATKSMNDSEAALDNLIAEIRKPGVFGDAAAEEPAGESTDAPATEAPVEPAVEQPSDPSAGQDIEPSQPSIPQPEPKTDIYGFPVN